MATDQNLPKKIAVLMGGPGSERDVSLATGRGVSKALRSLGAEVVDVDVHDEHFALPKDVDLAFITIHGTFGEDGQLQKILEERGVPYTGDGVEAKPGGIRQNFVERKISRTQRRHSGMGSRRSRPAPNDFGSAGSKAGETRFYRWRGDCKKRERT